MNPEAERLLDRGRRLGFPALKIAPATYLIAGEDAWRRYLEIERPVWLTRLAAALTRRERCASAST